VILLIKKVVFFTLVFSVNEKEGAQYF